jgi:hypothetical protein
MNEYSFTNRLSSKSFALHCMLVSCMDTLEVRLTHVLLIVRCILDILCWDPDYVKLSVRSLLLAAPSCQLNVDHLRAGAKAVLFTS